MHSATASPRPSTRLRTPPIAGRQADPRLAPLQVGNKASRVRCRTGCWQAQLAALRNLRGPRKQLTLGALKPRSGVVHHYRGTLPGGQLPRARSLLRRADELEDSLAETFGAGGSSLAKE